MEDMTDVLEAIDTPSVKLKIGLIRLWNTFGYEEGKNGYLLVGDWGELAVKVELLNLKN